MGIRTREEEGVMSRLWKQGFFAELLFTVFVYLKTFERRRRDLVL